MFDKEWAKVMIIAFALAFVILFGIKIAISIQERESQIISPQAHDMGDGVRCYTLNADIACLELGK